MAVAQGSRATGKSRKLEEWTSASWLLHLLCLLVLTLSRFGTAHQSPVVVRQMDGPVVRETGLVRGPLCRGRKPFGNQLVVNAARRLHPTRPQGQLPSNATISDALRIGSPLSNCGSNEMYVNGTYSTLEQQKRTGEMTAVIDWPVWPTKELSKPASLADEPWNRQFKCVQIMLTHGVNKAMLRGETHDATPNAPLNTCPGHVTPQYEEQAVHSSNEHRNRQQKSPDRLTELGPPRPPIALDSLHGLESPRISGISRTWSQKAEPQDRS